MYRRGELTGVPVDVHIQEWKCVIVFQFVREAYVWVFGGEVFREFDDVITGPDQHEYIVDIPCEEDGCEREGAFFQPSCLVMGEEGVSKRRTQRRTHCDPILLTIVMSIEEEDSTFGRDLQQPFEVTTRDTVNLPLLLEHFLRNNVDCFIKRNVCKDSTSRLAITKR